MPYLIVVLIAALGVGGVLLKSAYSENDKLTAKAAQLEQSLERQSKEIIELNNRASELDRVNVELSNRKAEIIEKTRVEVRYAQEVIKQDVCAAQPVPDELVRLLNSGSRD